MRLFSISYRRCRWTVSPPAWHAWSVLCPFWSSMFDRLIDSAHYLPFVLASAVRTKLFVGWVRVEVFLGFGFSWSTYWKRFSPVPSSHCGRCTLIQCAVTLDPRMHHCVDCTKVTEILLLAYPHVLEEVFWHLFSMRLDILFRVSPASSPSRPSMEETRGENCHPCRRQASRYIFLLALSTSWRHF